MEQRWHDALRPEVEKAMRAFIRGCPKELWAEGSNRMMVMFATDAEKNGVVTAKDNQQYCVDYGVAIVNLKTKKLNMNEERLAAMMERAGVSLW